MTRKINVLLFYKFELIENPEKFAKEQLKFCKELGVFGKILVAKEGINGSVSGTIEQTEKYKNFLIAKKGFEKIIFKEEFSEDYPFLQKSQPKQKH